MKNFIPAERKVNLEIRTGWCSVPAVDVTAWELISKIWLSRKLKENPTWGKNFGENTFLQSVLCWGRDILGSSNIITQVAVWVWKNHPCPRSLNLNKGWVCLCLSLPSTLSWYLLFLGSHVNVVTFTLSWLGKKRMTAYKLRLWSKSPAPVSILSYIFPSSLFVFQCYV